LLSQGKGIALGGNIGYKMKRANFVDFCQAVVRTAKSWRSHQQNIAKGARLSFSGDFYRFKL